MSGIMPDPADLADSVRAELLASIAKNTDSLLSVHRVKVYVSSTVILNAAVQTNSERPVYIILVLTDISSTVSKVTIETFKNRPSHEELTSLIRNLLNRFQKAYPQKWRKLWNERRKIHGPS